jgi:hypothetical protein
MKALVEEWGIHTRKDFNRQKGLEHERVPINGRTYVQYIRLYTIKWLVYERTSK